MNTLILGLGNVLLQDEGVGVRVVERLRAEYVFPEEVTVLDGGTLGLDLLQYLEGATHVVAIDVVKAGQPPGALIRLQNEEIPAFSSSKLSPHQIGLPDLLALAQLRAYFPQDVVLLGVEPARFDPGLELSPPVAAQVGTLAAYVLAELARWGIGVERRAE